MRNMGYKCGAALALWADEVAIAFAVQRSRVASFPSFIASDLQPQRVREPAFLEPASFTWNGGWPKFSIAGS